ncbi:MAG: UDP-N-acetylmuramate--L-alanine ligase [Verrucomicrobiaceae bacterium]|nr:MAG: UDP-N-acetylmuramate--L-alanine ligase [Verrucomicrobiaceae bacterium]
MVSDFLTAADSVRPQRIHLIGVAGSGMSGIASLLLDLGYEVSGSDRSTTAETERLQAAGLEFYCPHTAESVAGAGVIVYSSAIKAGRNLAYDAAAAAGLPLFRRAEALASIMARKQGIVIAGMHGKTTTSSMTAHVLRQAGLNPGHYVGAETPLLGVNALWDKDGEFFVAEGDESDGTLVLYHPRHTILLNVEEEHLDHYKDIHEINAVYSTLIDQTSGAFYYCASDPGARGICEGRERAVGYGWDREDDYSAQDLEFTGQSTAFTVTRRGQPLGRIILNIPGRHNVLNALAVTALAVDLGVPFERIVWALSTFRGARRRFEVKLRSPLCTVVDDYGHHPTEIAATLQTARQFARQGRVICVFQPHRFTRTQLLRKEFGRAFSEADAVFILDIYPASELPIPGITGETIVEEIQAHEKGRIKVVSTPNRETAHLAVGNFLRPGDLVITLGAGNVHETGTRLATDLRTAEGLLQAQGEEGAVVRLYEPMSRHTTMRIGGPAQFWLEPSTVAGFSRLVQHCREQGIPCKVVGRGSNLLIRDGGLKGAVIHPEGGEFDEITVHGDGTITAGVGVKFKRLAAAARNAGLGGFEWMEGIPGSVGGGLRMNAGAMGQETFDQVVSVTVLDSAGNFRERTREEMDVRYRSVPELVEHMAVRAVFRGQPAAIETIDGNMKASVDKRRGSQPVAASAGCIFKNPAACPAGKLVQELGLKNLSVGQARVSEVHGNFIVNEGGATARDVLDLIALIRRKAKEDRGIDMETEVQIIGEDTPY